VSEDVMMLDAHDSIYIWIGKDSNKDERDKAVQMVMEYVKTGDYIHIGIMAQKGCTWSSLLLALFNENLSSNSI
jgi:hypothetical protein